MVNKTLFLGVTVLYKREAPCLPRLRGRLELVAGARATASIGIYYVLASRARAALAQMAHDAVAVKQVQAGEPGDD